MDRQAEIEGLLARLRRLRGTGPVQPEFYQWIADARQYLAAEFGDPSPELSEFLATVFVNTPPDDAFMHHEGPWGLFERIDRAETLLRRFEAAGSVAS
jgi:hypothetical protein